MKKILLLLLIISQNLFSQDHEFKLSQKIDSIATINGRYGISEGKIETKNRKGIILGTGGFSYQTFVNYTDNEVYENLSRVEKQKHRRKSELVKGHFHQVLHNTNSYTENIDSDFYYQNNELIYVKIKIIRSKKEKKDQIQYFEYNLKRDNIENEKYLKNEFLFEYRSFIREKNKKIVDLYNN
ncbi:MAG TPA: hypothetical protein VJL37_11265 [Flavobacterium sp.]|nr:hypothetical protein [Flavobacterium sp.]